jgi:hypothetical protein
VTPQTRIVSISPNQITAGESNVDIEINGSGFSSVTSVSFGAGVDVDSFQALSASQVRATIDVDPDANPGPRTVTVSTSSGSATLDAVFEILKNRPPKASFTVDPPSGTQATLFTFDGRGSTDPDEKIREYLWDFGDGNTSTKAVAKHRFANTGKHTVTLTVTDQANQKHSKKESVHVSFDIKVAGQQIDAVCKEFLRLFGDLESLSAEEIVVGFSKSAGCPGRQREIDIIHQRQSLGGFVHVDILQTTQINSINEQTANAQLGARFYGQNRNGNFDGIVTHEFQMVSEPAGWKICNFIAY